MLSDAVSSEACFAPVLLGQDLSVILGGFLLNWSTIVADAVTSFRQMYPCLDKAGHPTSWWNLSLRESSGLLKWKPGQELSSWIITAINLQGNPLGGG